MFQRLDLKNIIKKDEFKEQFERKIMSLLDMAPSDACASSKIVKKDKGYFGVLQLCSAEGRFDACAAHSKLDELVTALIAQMTENIKNWRDYRFLVGREKNSHATHAV